MKFTMSLRTPWTRFTPLPSAPARSALSGGLPRRPVLPVQPQAREGEFVIDLLTSRRMGLGRVEAEALVNRAMRERPTAGAGDLLQMALFYRTVGRTR